jgi:hypothetical protein
MQIITKNKDNRVGILIKETLYNSAAQAIVKIYESPFFTIKIFLLASVLVSSSLCSYLILELIVSYLSYSVVTVSRTLYETPALFPKVTICNVNPFTTQYAVEFIRKINKDLNPNISIFNEEVMSRLNFSIKYGLIEKVKLQSIIKMNNLNETEKRKLTHPLEDLMQNCSFKNIQCEASDFTWYFDSFYGNCWIFNTAGQNFSSFPGESNGLKMVVYVSFHKNLSTLNSFNSGGLGALIRIDNSSYLTSYLPEDGIKIQPGYKTSVALSRSFKSNLPRPYSDCLIDNKTNSGFRSELFDLVQNSSYRYTQPTCFLQCFQNFILLKCNCSYSSLISLFPNNTHQCLTSLEIDCMKSLMHKDHLLRNGFFQENCSNLCPLECYKDEFDESLSSFELVSDFYLDVLKMKDLAYYNEKMSPQKNFVNFNIFYKSLSYEVSYELPQTNFIWLIANIGGYLSLFLGVSLFSFVELIQLVIELILQRRSI